MSDYKKTPLKYKKERVVLSDILPYEIPVTFSNKHFYQFLLTHKIELHGSKVIIGKKNDAAIEEIVKILFGINRACPCDENNSINISDNATQPFNFKIAHKENDFRALTIVHTKSQLNLVDFYDKYRNLIVYYCKASPFSIRKPSKIARYTFFKDKEHYQNTFEDDRDELIEESSKEYENVKTFFVYKHYSNIHKFYESYRYHRAEKKYDKLYKFDISKCFDSIYTHSISWALLEKEVVKMFLKRPDKTFGAKFDALMQKANYNETNGIVIGPEFSRIFAELILQRIDLNVCQGLHKQNIHHRSDYDIYRYVDDYFVFYNSESHKDEILNSFRLELQKYKLYLNDEKTKKYEKPLITEITIAKQRITDLFNDCLKYELLRKEEDSGEKYYDGEIFVDSNKLITKFKTIIKDTQVQYKDILNYTFSILERKIIKIVSDFTLIRKETNSEKKFTRAFLEILDFVFFIYSVSPRVNTTIKLCRTLRRITEYFQTEEKFNFDYKHLVYKKIYDNVYFLLQKNKAHTNTQLETLYLLIALGELGAEYFLEEDVLASYLNINFKHDELIEDIDLDYQPDLNYFTIVVSLFYIKGYKRYSKLRQFLKRFITYKFCKVNPRVIRENTELVLLLFDCLVCPYLDIEYRKSLLVFFEISSNDLQEEIIMKRKYWFTKWSKFNFGKELDAKQGMDVY